ncbi:nucleotidyltransferase domain-containing protein [Sutcliffiella horikoshii]|uniref:nucleotidyltransferase domain-containing protein n=1 Tax=Sutcliffiella horikoshii TaxID=79883 RepID=UPI001F35463B|nr:nucleotidyltransferase domain-containing protein [Sutcliffiella horikoshii]MCG1021483.1 nucleotidyltransferase domain-containing protein [Sutcliffiella horikoshii]
MNHLRKGYGLDEKGFIVRDVGVEKIALVYQKCVQETIETLHLQLPNLLHSVYVYGSVARGDAEKGKSDLDILAIFKRDLHNNENQRVKKLGESLSRKYHSLVREVGIAKTTLDYCMDPNNYYEQAFLRELCVCVDGEDLRERFGPYKLTEDIAISFNGDIAEVSERYLKKLNGASDDEFNATTQGFARKLIRTFYSMVLARSQIWSTKLGEQAEIFLQYFPEKKDVVQTLQEWTNNAPQDKLNALAILDKESKWAIDHFTKEAKKRD